MQLLSVRRSFENRTFAIRRKCLLPDTTATLSMAGRKTRNINENNSKWRLCVCVCWRWRHETRYLAEFVFFVVSSRSSRAFIYLFRLNRLQLTVADTHASSEIGCRVVAAADSFIIDAIKIHLKFDRIGDDLVHSKNKNDAFRWTSIFSCYFHTDSACANGFSDKMYLNIESKICFECKTMAWMRRED